MSNITQDPTAGGGGPHASSHAAGGTDPISPSSIGAAAAAHTHTPAQVGLANVTNDAQVKRSEIGTANGVAPLDANLKVPAAHLPPVSGAIPATLLDVKGDLVVASAADTAARLAPGADGQVLTADAAAALGVRWGAPGSNATAIRGVPVSTTAPASGQILKYNGAEYAPAADNAGAGGGLGSVLVPTLTKETGPGDTTSSAANRTNLQAAFDNGVQMPVLMDVAGTFSIDQPIVIDRPFTKLMGHGRSITTIAPRGYTGATFLIGKRPNPLTSDYDANGALVTKRHLQRPLVGSVGNSFTLFDPAAAFGSLDDYARLEVWPLRMSADVDLNGRTAFCLRGFFVFDATNTDTRPIVHSSGTFSRRRALDYGYGLWANGNALQARAKIGGTAYNITDPTARANGTVLHFAITYDGATLRLFVNGALVASVAATGAVNQEPWENVVIGPVFNTPSGDIVQYSPMGRVYSVELRQTATYTANFTAPTTAHTADADTLFLTNGELPSNTRLRNWCVMGVNKSNGAVYLQHAKYNTPNVNIWEVELTDFGINCGSGPGITGIWCEGSHPILFRRLSIQDARIAIWCSRNSYDALVDECLLDGHPTRGWVTCAMLWAGNFEIRQTTVTTGPIGIWVGGFGGTGRIHESWMFGGNVRLALIVNGNNAEHTYLSLRNFYTTDEDRSAGDPYLPFAGVVITDIDVIRGGGWGTQINQGDAVYGAGHNIPPLMLYGKVPNIRDFSSETTAQNQTPAHVIVNGRVGRPVLFEGRYTKKPTALPWVVTAADAVYAAISTTEPA